MSDRRDKKRNGGLALVLLALAWTGCGGAAESGDLWDLPGFDLGDGAERTEVPGDPGSEDGGQDEGVEPGGSDVGSDAWIDEGAGGGTDEGGGADSEGEVFFCPPPASWPPVDSGDRKFALTMFHWNIQYVAGGLVGEWQGRPISICEEMFGDPDLCEGWDDDALNDWIIRVSFLPILDLYLAHPDWRATFEMPGLMVEAMAERHPDVLAKLQCAANSGQIEVVSLHWSDQLFLAFPARDLWRSALYNRVVFERAAIPLSTVVFNQEGQSGVGKHRVMAEMGYSVDVMHRNLYRYHQRDDVDDGVWPYYRSLAPGAPRPVYVVVSGAVDPEAGVEVTWSFFDDGEVLATPGNPYLAPVQPDPDLRAIRDFEAKLERLAAEGYLHTTITDYVARLQALGIEPRPLLPIADSTWQPPSTEGISRWMGRMGTLGYSFHENDNRIRTGNYEASTCLMAATLLADEVERNGHSAARERLWIDQGYLDLFRAEVSDATGINPWLGEWVYGYRYNESALAQCRNAVDALLARWGRNAVVVDLDEAAVKEDWEFQPQFSFSPTPPEEVPVALDLSAAGRQVETRWENDGQVYRLEVWIGESDDPGGEDREKRTVTLRMPMADGVLRYSPALIEDRVVSIPLDQFRLLANRIYLPLANGLIGLGPNLWGLKSCREMHLAARVTPGDPAMVEFVDETVPAEGGVRWVFFVLRGSEQEALALARLLNTHPHVRFERSEPSVPVGMGSRREPFLTRPEGLRYLDRAKRRDR